MGGRDVRMYAGMGSSTWLFSCSATSVFPYELECLGQVAILPRVFMRGSTRLFELRLESFLDYVSIGVLQYLLKLDF